MKKIGIISLICILIDQIIKIIVSTNIKFTSSINIISNFFRITYLKNYGAAWSILTGDKIFLILVSFIALILIYYFFLKNKKLNNIEEVLYGLLIGGVIGNLIDRIRLGYVIDYLDFNILNYNYPVFNLADSLIVISIIFLVVLNIKDDKNGNSSR